MRILVIGAGATGGFYGGRLARAGRDVTFLVRERRAAELRRDGLRLRTPEGEDTIAPQLISSAELREAAPFDLILLGVKAYTLEAAMEDFAAAVGPETMIVPMQNGLRHLEMMSTRFAPRNVLGGVCRIVATMDPQGAIVQMTHVNQLAYGELDGLLSERIQRVHATLSDAGFEATLEPDILQFMWEKWIMLSALGSICVLGGDNVGAIRAVEDLDDVGLRLEMSVIDEATAIAAAWGHPPREAWRRMMHGYLTAQGSSLESSMYRDYKAGNPVEAWQILGDIVRRGRERGVATPLLEAAFVRLRTYERNREAR